MAEEGSRAAGGSMRNSHTMLQGATGPHGAGLFELIQDNEDVRFDSESLDKERSRDLKSPFMLGVFSLN